MIQENELRKNSIISYKGKYMRVVGIMGSIYLSSLDGRTFSHTVPKVDIEGVPLSPEVLSACGFVEDRDQYDGETIIVRLGCIELHHDEDQPLTGYSIAVYDDGNICFAGHDIRYLHQLMNLHHDLTGTELSINLEQVTP